MPTSLLLPGAVSDAEQFPKFENEVKLQNTVTDCTVQNTVLCRALFMSARYNLKLDMRAYLKLKLSINKKKF